MGFFVFIQGGMPCQLHFINPEIATWRRENPAIVTLGIKAYLLTDLYSQTGWGYLLVQFVHGWPWEH